MPAVSSVPIILVSGERDAARIGLELGVADGVAKPFEADQLLGLIASYRPPHR
jgi:DNA-binding response OmpR family regulator